MVNKKLLKELKNLMETGASSAKPEHIPKIFEFFKQIGAEDEYIQEELEELDIDIMVQCDEQFA